MFVCFAVFIVACGTTHALATANTKLAEEIQRARAYRIPAQEGSVVANTRPDHHRPRRGLRILVIDDDPLLLKLMRDTLESDGHRVDVADGGLQSGRVGDGLGTPDADGK